MRQINVGSVTVAFYHNLQILTWTRVKVKIQILDGRAHRVSLYFSHYNRVTVKIMMMGSET
jgi:hypothetical protein